MARRERGPVVSAREWKPGDRALLPVVVAHDTDPTRSRGLISVESGDDRLHAVYPGDLIPDDRRPSWLPGQPGDVAEWGGQRWMRRRERWCAVSVDSCLSSLAEDDEVPADAVLVLPATTREAQ